MTIESFEHELQTLHKDFTILRNVKAVGLATIFFKGVPQFAIGAGGVFEEPNSNYGIELPSGSYVRHRTRPEALAMCNKLIYDLKNDVDNYEARMGLGKYSDAALK